MNLKECLDKNWLEWYVFAVALCLLLGTAGYLGWDAVTTKNAPPRLLVTTDKPRQFTFDGKTHYVVPVHVKNEGDRTAEGVKVEIVLERSGAEPETAGFDAPYVPRKSVAEGEVSFLHDPNSGTLKSRVLGYEKP